MNLDGRWRAAPLPESDDWRRAGFDDRSWKPVTAADRSIWDADGSKQIALRRAVLWKSARKPPGITHQWLPMVRDRMVVAEGSAGAFVHILPAPGEWPEDTLIAAGMNVVFASLEERNGVLDYFLSLKKRDVYLAWGFNVRMNWHPGSAIKG